MEIKVSFTLIDTITFQTMFQNSEYEDELPDFHSKVHYELGRILPLGSQRWMLICFTARCRAL